MSQPKQWVEGAVNILHVGQATAVADFAKLTDLGSNFDEDVERRGPHVSHEHLSSKPMPYLHSATGSTELSRRYLGELPFGPSDVKESKRLASNVCDAF